jgi:hypothetical protein
MAFIGDEARVIANDSMVLRWSIGLYTFDVATSLAAQNVLLAYRQLFPSRVVA